MDKQTLEKANELAEQITTWEKDLEVVRRVMTLDSTEIMVDVTAPVYRGFKVPASYVDPKKMISELQKKMEKELASFKRELANL